MGVGGAAGFCDGVGRPARRGRERRSACRGYPLARGVYNCSFLHVRFADQSDNSSWRQRSQWEAKEGKKSG